MAKRKVEVQLTEKTVAPTVPRPVSIFYSYAHQDERLRNELDKQLSPLRRSGQISTWHDRQITPGSDFANEIDRRLVISDLVLLLISPDFLASDFCYRREMQCAIERHLDGLARVVPIILRPCDWQSTPIGHLLALPKNGKPVTSWQRRGEAFLDVAKGVRRAVEELSGWATVPVQFSVAGEQLVSATRRRA